MDQNFRQAFEKTARVNLLNAAGAVPKSMGRKLPFKGTTSGFSGGMRSGSPPVAKPISSPLVKPAPGSALRKGVALRSKPAAIPTYTTPGYY